MTQTQRIHVEFADRFRLWQEFVLASDRDGKVFVPSDLKEEPGVEVVLSVRVGRSEPLEIAATVDSRRSASQRFQRGLFLTLSADEVGKLREELGLMLGGTEDGAVRRERRYIFKWRVDFRTPALLKPVKTLDISPNGMHVEMPERVRRGHVTEFRLRTSQGHELGMAGTVMWTSETTNRVGIRFLFDDDAAASMFRGVLEHASMVEEYESQAGPLPEHTVLVADDEPEIVEMLTRMLIKRRFHVLSATTGEEALSLIRQEKPDFVLLDVLMPRMDGETVCRSVRDDADLKGLPIVLISALGEDELEERAQRSGATAWLQKPVRPRMLLDLVDELLTVDEDG